MAAKAKHAGKEELSEEQLEEIKKFVGLPPEKKLELIEQQCIFCQIAKGGIETIKVFEDSEVIAVLDINPAVPGHTLIFPKKHFQFLFQISAGAREKIFSLASSLSIYLVNVLKAGGFNLYVANGATAGQKMPHFVLHLIPRFDKDGLSFEWDAKKASQEELRKIASLLKANLDKEGEEKKNSLKEEKQAQSDSAQELERALKFRRRA